MTRGGADSAASGRNSYVDLLRAVAIGAVVVGHWLLTAVRYQGGHFDGVDALSYVSWGSWVTLVLQVVPVFFLVGGYANALSWSRRRAAGGSWDDWLRLRMRRLLGPTTTYTACAVLAVAAAGLAGTDAGDLEQAAWALAFHLWFLAAYAVLLAVTPMLYAAHRRWAWAVPLAMAAMAVAISAGVVTWHWHLVGWANYLLVWGAFHQLGFAWYDGKFGGRRGSARALALAAASGAALAALIWWGPFPVSMVGVPGARIQNPSPPSMALLAFGLTQSGLVLWLEPWANRRLARRPGWRVLARTGAALSMPVYLWHMVPVVLVVVIAYPLGWFAQPPIGSGSWWAQRAVWIAVLSALLAGLVTVLVRLRQRRTPRQRPLAAAAAEGLAGTAVGARITASGLVLLGGVAMVAAALGRLAVEGFAPSGRIDVVTIGVFVAGAAVVVLSGPQPRRGPAAVGRREVVGSSR